MYFEKCKNGNGGGSTCSSSNCSDSEEFSDDSGVGDTGQDEKNPRKSEHGYSLLKSLLENRDALLDRVIQEFDGTTVLCRVCGDKASGFHYGVHSCEGCKGFFRRSIQQKIQYRPCTKNQQCSILRVNRNRCQYCRLKKCIAVGMSRDAVRFGRVPKREKAKILAAMQQSHNQKTAERALSNELEDLEKLAQTVIQAHNDTCEFTHDKVKALYQKATYNENFYTDGQQRMACPLNPVPRAGPKSLDFSERFSPAIRGVVEFAKRVPGFSMLSQDDQVTLLKAGVFEVLLVRLSLMFDQKGLLCMNGDYLPRERLSTCASARFLLDSMFKFSEQLNSLNLNDDQVGLFCSLVVMAPDRPGLRNLELISRLEKQLRCAVARYIPSNLLSQLQLKIPDLRTLNTLHSEKLLAFKMEDEDNKVSPKRQTESPSGDSGIESGACSSPARSDVDEHMPVLKRALQAPPMNEYKPHKKFRYSMNSASQRWETSSSSSSTNGDLSPPQTPVTSWGPQQLYPQLASALTQPPLTHLTDIKPSTHSEPLSKTHATLCRALNEPHHSPVHHHPAQQSPQTHHLDIKPSLTPEPLSKTHVTLARTLSEQPKHVDSKTNDLLHSIIMSDNTPLNLSLHA